MSAFKNCYFGKMSDGTWIIGESLKDKITPGPYKQTFSSNGEVELIGIKNQSTGEFEATPRPVTNYTDLDGNAYENYEAFNTATKDFFFKLGGGIVTGDYLVLSSSGVRFGWRNNGWVIDKTLTPTGFDGAENTDWVQVGGEVSA